MTDRKKPTYEELEIELKEAQQASVLLLNGVVSLSKLNIQVAETLVTVTKSLSTINKSISRDLLGHL